MADPAKPTLSSLLPCLLSLLLAASVWLSRGCVAAPAEQVSGPPPTTIPVVPGDPADDSHAALLARTDQTALLTECLAAYDARPVTDFTCTFTRMEVIRGRAQPRQQAHIWFRQQPFSLAMHWTVNPPGGDRVVYVEGLYPDSQGQSQMLVRPTGEVARLLTGGSILRSPTAPDVLAQTLRPVTAFGFRNTLMSMIDVCHQAQAMGKLHYTFDGYADVNGRPCLVLTRAISQPWREDIPAWTRIFIDRQLLLPIRLEGYDSAGRPMWEYQFDDLRLNVGLTDRDFTPNANDIPLPN